MRKNNRLWIAFLLTITVWMMSCSSTRITRMHFDEAYADKPVSNILVIAVTGNEHNRRSFERKFVRHLKAAGAGAIASETVIPMPPDLKIKKEAITDAVEQQQNDAVIITYLIGKKIKAVHTRGGNEDSTFYGYSFDTGYSSLSKKVRLLTNLFDAKTGKKIWVGKSTALTRDSADQVMSGIIKAVVKDLQKQGLIASNP